MLIDCGVLKGTDEAKARMRAIVSDIAKTTAGHLDILVVTHEHWDHVSGFVLAQAEFDRTKLSISEVWLAWTEKPGDDLADQLREHKKKARKAVDAALQKLKLSAAPAAKTAIMALNALSQFSGDFGAGVSYSTAEAMTWARERTGARVRWLTPGDDPLPIPGLDGVRVFVLGPPRDPKLLRKSDPSKRAPEVYQLAGGMDSGFMAALLGDTDVDSGRPFDESYRTPFEVAKGVDFFHGLYFSEGDSWRQIELDWLGTAERLALQLDSDTNNTSLVLAIELIDSARVLLFPGDAQVGNWLSWEPLAWTLKGRDGEPVNVTSKKLLGKTVLYKVAHHASHNATLREKGLELMQSDELVAMIPVYEEQAHDQGKDGWEMPFPPLLTRLQEKTSGRIVRADKGVSATWPNVGPKRPDVENADYIDYIIDL